MLIEERNVFFHKHSVTVGCDRLHGNMRQTYEPIALKGKGLARQ